MADTKELKRKRGSYKGRLTVFANYLSILKDSLTPCQVTELQLRIDKLESLYDEFNDVQLQLECSCENIEDEIAERTTIESQYYSVLANAKNIISTYSKPENDDYKSVCSISKRQLVKLPTINLPKFSGSYDKWLEFRDTFSSLIHDNDDIDNVNKFHYLRTSLEGSAAVVIQSVEFSAQNYVLAWDLLCERFNNRRLLIQNHVSALFTLEPITKESSVAIKRMIDHVNKNIRALGTLGEPVNTWDTLLIHLISQKLDTKTFREWEEFKGRLDQTKSIPFEKFMEFMRNRSDLVETLEISRPLSNVNSNIGKQNTKHKAMVSLNNNNSPSPSSSHCCPQCKGDHNLNTCPQFLALSIDERLSVLPSFKVCYNCFRRGHFSNNCKKQGCKACNRKHHTLIHNKQTPVLKHSTDSTPTVGDVTATGKESPPSRSSAAGAAAAGSADNIGHVALAANITAQSHSASYSSDILLSTALIRCYDVNNKEHIARALLDSGSTSCLMTESLFKRLGLPFMPTYKSIQGINNSLSRVEKRCRVNIKSLSEAYSTTLSCFVLPAITDNVPSRQVEINIPTDIQLADPYFHTPKSIDIIIGADVFWHLLGSEKIILGDRKPILYQTRLGWLVCGPISSGFKVERSPNINCNFLNVRQPSSSKIDEIQTQLMRFWQLEEICHESSIYSDEEKQCEEHFIRHTSRLANGRFSVKIPLKESPNVLGDSFHRAKRCLLSLERRNENKASLNMMYKAFMAEYISLGHMSECNINEDTLSYFIPHHGVLRESSTTTKLRVVFNASAPTSSGISLNNIQMVGPTIQDDLVSILLRFRIYKYVLSADVEKMYRCISLDPSDRDLLKILWRDNISSSLKAYRLNTVTYGLASSSFLATRCLKQIGLDCTDERVSEVIIHDFLMDDLLSGADTFQDALSLRHKVTEALASACMPLRKWKSNEPALIPEQPDQSLFDLNIEGDALNKTLGLGWQTKADELCFPISIPSEIKGTKRDMLAVIARIFDPLGLLAPCVIRLKMLLQRLWLDKYTWDEELSNEVVSTWVRLIEALPTIHELRIPRRVVCDSYQRMELHIFTDASERAYGACLHVRSVDMEGNVTVSLMIAKSRVTPIKPVTIPRLELCAAVVGAQLYKKVASSLRTQASSVYFWTDSMIVLGWLKMLPIRLNTFVRNRVAVILDITSPHSWRHVPTHENPADLISRGVEATTIRTLDLWWHGPSFLRNDSNAWPRSEISESSELPEMKSDICLLTSHKDEVIGCEIITFERFSNLLRLQRAVCYMFRFINRIGKRLTLNSSHLSVDELRNSLNFIIIQSQKESFPEYKLLVNNKSIPLKSQLLKLNVFLDNDKILRVGGRLHNSEYSFEKKHPILIQSSHHFTKLLFRYEHLRLLHAGPQLLLATIRETYWPLGGRNLARSSYRQCVKCKRLKGKVVTPQMGNLPATRLSPTDFPFQNVGVDYAGPISSASRQGRGCRIVKVYIVVFVCFTTKAMHLELVGDLTSSNYLQALRRFMSRRGKPLNIYSDNGTSFVGAYNELSRFLKRNCDSLADSVAQDGVKFHFIPAYAPNFAGLMEAGVKSTKGHLVRVLGNCMMTYEELNSTLVQIEGILNSRPLTPLSSNSEDLLPLTPGHFLIGRPFTSLPVQDLRDCSNHSLTRYQRIEQMRQHFWARWSKEYVSELQQRVKWHTRKDPLEIGSLVLIKDDHLPPLMWKMGRIVALHPGSDNICRVADILTANGVVRRASSKICPLLDSPVERQAFNGGGHVAAPT